MIRNRHREAIVRKAIRQCPNEILQIIHEWQAYEGASFGLSEVDAELQGIFDRIRLTSEELAWIKREEAEELAREEAESA